MLFYSLRSLLWNNTSIYFSITKLNADNKRFKYNDIAKVTLLPGDNMKIRKIKKEIRYGACDCKMTCM